MGSTMEGVRNIDMLSIEDENSSDGSSSDDEMIPRDYQTALMEIAINKNTIIFLPTGSGKTFIATLVLKRLSEPLNRPYSSGGKVSFILVNTVALVPQHAKYIKDHTPFNVGCYTGEMNLDFWERGEWEAEFNKFQVLIMTSQILLNIITTGFIDLSNVNLIIFDECHRGVDDHPMRQIMKSFKALTVQPRVLGLTATLLNGNIKLQDVRVTVEGLETTFHSSVATVDSLEKVVGHSTNPREQPLYCDTHVPSQLEKYVMEKFKKVYANLQQVRTESSEKSRPPLGEHLVLLEPVDVLKKLKNLIKDLEFHIEVLGMFGAFLACKVYMIQIERIRKHCDDVTLLVTLNYVTTKLGWAKRLFENAMKNYSEKERLRKFSSDKVATLLDVFDRYKRLSEEELCALIFVKRRFTARIIHHILEAYKAADPTHDHIKSNFVVGNSNNPYNSTREGLYISKKNREVLDSFVNKEINVLVSSSVLEEGVDIPMCTLVVKFDKPEEYRSYIQSKGRARHRLSLYFMIVEQADRKRFDKLYEEFQNIEQLLNDFLIGKNSLRGSPTQSNIQNMYDEDEIPPYYVNGPQSAKVTMASAVSLLCRYCSSLSRDKYTSYEPQWYLEKKETSIGRDASVRVVIYLPIICPIVEPIKGRYMSNKKSAKRAAALEVCKALHKCGELDDNLLPVKKEFNEEEISYLFEHWPEEKEEGAGVKKRKRLYNNEIAACLQGGIHPNKNIYLHVIKLEPQNSTQDDYNVITVQNLYRSKLRFGVLTPEPIPELCKFPIYDSVGIIEVEIQANVKWVVLSQEEILILREFHRLLFSDLLEVLKEFQVFDNTSVNSETMLVVPIQNDENVRIDFDAIAQNKTLKDRFEPTAADRINLQVNQDTYWLKIVSPWYRNQSSMYVVTRVVEEKTAKSCFPNDDYGTFYDYYKNKHNKEILNPNQPLLLVKGLSRKLNVFKPPGHHGKRKRDARYEELEEYLIPELVIKQEFPSCLWVQARFLPCILSRLGYLLKLKQLQDRIAEDMGIDLNSLGNCPTLKLDEHLLNFRVEESLSDKPCELPDNANTDLLALECDPSPVTQQFNKDFAMKKLEAEYCWKTLEEPKDLEREVDVTIMDIEYYEEFIGRTASKESRKMKNSSPAKTQSVPAITYPQDYEDKFLGVLSIEYRNQSPNLCQIYEALTSAEANDIVNLERLETLGDSFLKFISSFYILFKFRSYNEGKATSLKGKLVSNKNLYYLANRRNFGGILKNFDFSPRNEWTPPCFAPPLHVLNRINEKQVSISSLFNYSCTAEEQTSGHLSKETLAKISWSNVEKDEENSYPSMCHFVNQQHVSDKTVADSVEALLGAYLLTGGLKGGVKFVEWIGIIPKSENVQKILDQDSIDPILNKEANLKKIFVHIPHWRLFEERLGYEFKNKAFLLQALTHSSYSPNRLTGSYERLEFIGDAILDFLITCYIYEHCGYLNPGQVTDLRSALVNNNTFASLVVRNQFHKFMLMINMELQKQIDKFAEYLASKDYVIDDEVLILLEEQDMHIAEYVDVPKVLGDIFEALAGAIFLDSGKDLKKVWSVFYKLMWKEIDLFSKNVPKNMIRRLYECHTAYPKFSAAVDVDNQKTMVALQFMCEGRKKRVHGFGSNKIMAKRAAAKIALRSLKL